MSTKEARNRAQKAYEKRRRESGEKKKTFWLSSDAWSALQRLKADDGSVDASVNVAIMALDIKRRAKEPTS